MSIYEQNLKVLAEQYPKIDTLIQKAQDDMEAELEIYKEESLDGQQIIKVKKEDTICYLNGKRNTKEPVQMWLKSIGDLAANAPVFIMGVGNSGYITELLNKMDERIMLFIYEPSLQLFVDFLKNTDISQWMRKHTIIFWVKGIDGMSIENMQPLLGSLLTYEMLPFARNLVLPNYEVLFPEETLEFLRLCRKSAMEEVISRNTKKLFSKVMVKNLFANARYLCDGYKTIQLIQVIPRDIPGIVVAAGPSLDKNIKELKRACGKALIIAVDTAVKPLLRENIKPDLVMIIDAMKPLELMQTEGSQNIPLVSTINAASEVLEYHKGKKFFFDEPYQFSQKIHMKSKERFGSLASGGSVATNAFSLLHKIGLTRIILVGQDLAYTNNRTYANGTFSEHMQEINTKGMYMVEGNYEEKVPVPNDLRTFLEWYNYAIPKIQEDIPEFHVINATEGGAKIKNTEVMTLKEAIDRECTKEVDIETCLNRLEPMLDTEARQWAVDYLKGLPNECNELAVMAKNLKKLYMKLDKICNKKNIDKKEYLSVLKKIKKGVQKLEPNSIYQLATISVSDAMYVINREQFLHENSVMEEGKEIARKGKLYMEMVEQCGHIFHDYAEEVFKDLK